MNIQISRFAWRILAVTLAALLTAGALIVATTKPEDQGMQKDPVVITKAGDCPADGDVRPC